MDRTPHGFFMCADLWKNVFDELPESKINEAAVHVENRIVAASLHDDEDVVIDRTDQHSSSRLADFIEARRRTSKAALKSFQEKLLTGTKKKITMRQLGIPLDDGNARFESTMCFKMQNFGNDDGYKSVLSGSDCTMQGKPDTASLNWKSESTFMIQCHRDGNTTQTTMIGMVHEEVSSIRAALKNSDGYASASCTFSIATQHPWSESHGSGAIVHSNVPLFRRNATHVFHTPMNAIRVRMCNLMVETRDASVSLESIRLNGKPLTSQQTLTEPQQSDECHGHTFRVPTVAVAEQFLLTGLAKISGDMTEFGPGGSSSIEISIGHVPAI